MQEEKITRFAILGCGFWAHYQLAAWLELEGVQPVALYNRTLLKAEALGAKYNITRCYDNAEELFQQEQLDFVDIITDVDTHEPFTLLAAKYKVPVICQKPMAPSLSLSGKMIDACNASSVPLYIHENFRWQVPIRKTKELLDSGIIGNAFKARVTFCSSFPVFDKQPFLATLEHFILTDVGSHILDICRFLFGEAITLYCQTATVNSKINGEDVANVSMKMKSGLHCYAEMSYASLLEKETFPQTLVLIEGVNGSIHLTHNFEIRVTTKKGTDKIIANPILYPWGDPDYSVVHSSIVDCNRNILQGIRGGKTETTGADNYETVKLVWAAYESAKHNQTINLSTFGVK